MMNLLMALMIGIVIGLLIAWAWGWPRVQGWRDGLMLRVLGLLARLRGSPPPGGSGGQGEGKPHS